MAAKVRWHMNYVDACQGGAWHLRVWVIGEVGQVQAIPFRCRSWRHAGDCSRWRGAQDFVRIRAAIKTRCDWTYVVLTYPHNDWPDVGALYKAGVIHWARLRKRLTRSYGPLAYLQTWERHRSGYPHVNVLLGNPGVFQACVDDWAGWRRRVLEPMAADCGFGKRTWVEVMRNSDAMSGYLTKLAEELTGGEGKDQTPRNAPPHFRRLRASRGLLPPPYKDPDLTGELKRSPLPCDDLRQNVLTNAGQSDTV